MNIGIDVDEVLAELVEAYLEYHNQKYNTKTQKKDMFSYSFREVLGVTETENEQNLFSFFKSEHFQKVRPIKGALKSVSLLAQKHQLCIITARPHNIREETKQWLSTYFPDCFHSIYLTNQWYGKGDKQLKSEVGKRQNIQIMIDDSLQHAQDCAAQGIYVLLADFNYPWNKTSEKLPENIKRVHSWEEIVKEVNKYEKEHG